ncbi:hypothetical protein [Pasteurella sp. PK-2025]|uniref:hypothetical protein n=1 Tax=Pasteurella sp. PK-2025 TaxID=3413133 RepID=UPI003C7560B6
MFDPTGWVDPLGLNGCGASTPSTEPHGNSKDSTKTQHLYEIYDVETGDVLKTGISGSSLNKNGTSPRANRQVSKLNGPVDDANPPKYAARIIDDSIPDRKTALQREVENAQKLHDEGNSMSLHKRPRSWEKQ